MDPDATRPIPSTRVVVYRCPCGNKLTLDSSMGGQCERCERTVSATALGYDMSSTVSLAEQRFELAQTHQGFSIANPSVPEVVLSDQPSDAEVLVGKRFGHFEIISPLGRGGMGQVYRALDTSLQRYVAVKVLRSGLVSRESGPASSDQEIDKLLQEAISQARVSHPNIVTIYYVGKEDGNPFLAMELVNGTTLTQKIAEGDLSFTETAKIGLELASALRESLELDIIHGDLKPANILIARDGTAKLSDFGMARIASENNTVASGGTPNYLAPEILLGVSTSAQSDIYALGVTLYEMTFGETPISLNGRNVADWIETHEISPVEFPTPWPPQLPESWRRVLSKMLAKEPEDRYQDYDELIEDLERFQTNNTVAARFVPRLIAAGLDLAMVLLITVGFQQVLVTALDRYSQLPPDSFLNLLFGSIIYLPMIAYTIAIYYWRQSIGRKLMHLRVVNQYGLRPTRREMLIRSILRMQFPWFVIVQIILNDPRPQTLFSALAYIASGLLVLADIAYMLVAANGASVHDWFSKTRVVLDTNDE